MEVEQLKSIISATIDKLDSLIAIEEYGLTPEQELFCQFYSRDRDCFGNGVQAYMRAYPHSSYASARRSASDFLTNPDILKRTRELMDLYVDEVVVDRELNFLITQNQEFPTKLGAIKHYNELKNRIVKKLDMTSGGQPITSDKLTFIDKVITEDADTRTVAGSP